MSIKEELIARGFEIIADAHLPEHIFVMKSAGKQWLVNMQKGFMVELPGFSVLKYPEPKFRASDALLTPHKDSK